MKQIPIIRFSQFDDKWGSIAIGDLAQIKRGASPRPIQDPKWFDKNSDIGWLRISDVTEQNGRIKYLEQKISKLGQEKTRVLNTPHLLLSIAATVGKPVVNYVKTGVHDGFLIFENPKFDREFMFQWFDMFRPKWNKYGQPGSQVNLNSDIIRNHKMMIPSLPEQSAIGSLFRTLDDLIASYKDNLTNYQSLKATMLSKMFPKSGQTIPEIRLDGFKEEWEVKKLRKVVQINPKSELPEKFKYIDLESVVGTRINKIREEYKETAPTRAQRLAEKGDIFYQTVRPYQKNNYLFKLDDVDYVFSTGYAQLRPKRTSCDSDFLLTLLQDNKFLSKVLDRCTGTSYPAINAKDLVEISIVIPKVEEQQAIGSYFSNLDNLINSHQEKISQLETLKKKLLQDMFI